MQAIIGERSGFGVTKHPEHAAFFLQLVKDIFLARCLHYNNRLSTGSCSAVLSYVHETWNRILPDLFKLFYRFDSRLMFRSISIVRLLAFYTFQSLLQVHLAHVQIASSSSACSGFSRQQDTGLALTEQSDDLHASQSRQFTSAPTLPLIQTSASATAKPPSDKSCAERTRPAE